MLLTYDKIRDCASRERDGDHQSHSCKAHCEIYWTTIVPTIRG